MAERKDESTRILGPLGAEVMGVLWSADGALPVRSVLDRLNEGREDPLAYTTVMTVLARLAERGAAKRTQAGRGYEYQAAVENVAQLAVDDLLRDHGDAAIAHFVERARGDSRLRERLERLMSSAEAKDPQEPHEELRTKS